MIHQSLKSRAFFIAITLIFFSVIVYLGIRTLEHEALLRHYQSQTLAQTRSEQASAFVMGLLQQKAARFDAVMNFVELNDKAVEALQEKDDDIDDIFVLQKNRLLYPDAPESMTQKEKVWVQTITPLVNDPSLLYSHVEKSEKDIPRAGWFIINETQEPILIYWRNENDQFIGFHVSYIKLLSDVINAADLDFSPDTLSLKENGRLLYQSHSDVQVDSLSSLYAANLPYPLNTWSVEYHGQTTGTRAVYLWGSLFLLVLLIAVGFIMFRLYREYTQTARLARQQVNFVSQVSHELKTPLTNITLYTELLKEELSESYEEGLHHADVIISESQRLSRLIQNILTFTHAPKIHIQTVDLVPLIAQIVQAFTPSFRAKGIVISLHLPDSAVIDSDVDRLTQVISNFLSNAEKYAASGKRVDLTVEAQTDYVDIHIRDYGPGIPEKEVRKIFQPFYRIKSTITEGVSGTGIGLTIARQLAENLHGEILVSHPTPGVQFTLRLKRTSQNPAAPHSQSGE